MDMAMTSDRHLDRKSLVETALKIQAWQLDKKLETAALIRKYPGLGSDKTYNRIIKGELTDMNVQRQAARYQGVLNVIESVSDTPQAPETLYDDLSTVVQVRRVMLETFGEAGSARFILIQGDTGSGKTTAARIMAQRYGERIVLVEVTQIMADSPYYFLRAILKGLGFVATENTTTALFEKVVDELNKSRRCIIIDELHHAKQRILNTIKSLINQTPGEFVGLAMPTLWQRMEKGAYDECRQLVGNRLAERIEFDQVNKSDIQKIITRRLPALAAAQHAAGVLERTVKGHGNLSFVRDVCSRARESYENETPISLDDFVHVVNAEKRSR